MDFYQSGFRMPLFNQEPDCKISFKVILGLF